MMHLKRFLMAVACLLVAVPLMGAEDSGCSTETVDEPAQDEAGGGGGGDGDGGDKPQKAAVGDALNLKGNEDGSKASVTAVKVIDPVSGGEYEEPEAGKRYVGVQFSIKNTGTTTYKDSPLNGAKLVLVDDTQAEATFVSGGPCGGSFASDTTIAPGARRVGCIPFEVPTAGKLKTIQFGLDSGFGPQSGEWVVR